jgi:hypothetical protein
MKQLLFLAIAFVTLFLISSCEDDEGLLPNIAFKTGGVYLNRDTSLVAGTNFIIGIQASKSEDKDVLKQFNVSKSINGAANSSLYDKSLSGAEGDNYNYDYLGTVENTTGQKTKYTFTVTNRDGLVNQVSLTVTTL